MDFNQVHQGINGLRYTPRSHTVSVRLTPKEYTTLADKAEKAGLTVSDLIRATLFPPRT